jgi:hypothetical protein
MVLSERFQDQFSEDEFAAVIPAETEAVRGQYRDGALRQIWLRGDTRGACFLLEADDPAAAEALVAALPMAQRKMSDFRIIPLSPYGGFHA